MLPLSLAHLVAQMGWAHAKGPKETDSYPLNHTSSISTNMSHGLEPCLKEYNIILYINWAHKEVGIGWIGLVKNGVTKMGINSV